MFKSQHQIEVYMGRGGKGWYWRARYVGSGVTRDKIVADGSESYSTKSNARRAARKIGRALAFASIVEVQNYNGAH